MSGPASKWVALILGSTLAGSTGVAAAAELPAPESGEFGAYEPVPLLDDTAPYAGPSTPTSLEGVHLGQWATEDLTPEALSRLEEQGFVVMPSRDRLFHEAYTNWSWDGTPTFVTTDAAYHSWHLVFDKILREVEQQRLLPALEQLVVGLLENAEAQRVELSGSELEDDATRVHDLLAVTAATLELPGIELSDRAAAELALVEEHSTSARSPVLETLTDYSLFTPRGHYTRNADLERYFVAMSTLGQHAFQLPGARDPDGTVIDTTAGLRRAVLASRVLVGHPELEELWTTIFEPTAFLVGVSDDYTTAELAAAVESVVPGGMADPRTITGAETLRTIADALKASRTVRIDPERPSVRLMGTRFVLDSWILDQLVGPNVGTQADPRVLASPLDLAAAFGSDFGLAIQEAAGQTAKLNYPEQMTAMREAVAGRPDEAWGGTVYDAWLAAVEPMWLPRGEAFPDFMRTPAWSAKAHQTGFGSYAELKHDTILYAKQAFGDTGGGPETLKLRQWVEPDPVPFERLSAMAVLTRDGLKARGLLPKPQRQLLNEYVDLVDRLARVAHRELAGQPARQKDNEWLTYIGSALESIWAQSGDEGAGWDPDVDKDAAIVADIMRGLDPVAGDFVVEVGTGYIDHLYVLVPDDDGAFRVARGGVFSYYEFPWPTSDRLNDTTWRKMLATDAAPARPEWQATLFPAAGIGSSGSAAPLPRPTKRDVEWELAEAILGGDWKAYRKSPKGVAFDPFAAGARTGIIYDRAERDLHKSVDYVVLFAFEASEALDGYWQARAEAAASDAPPRDGACLDGKPGRTEWQFGELLCYVSGDGTAVLRWTDERNDSYGVMNAVAGERRLRLLAKQWAKVV